MDRNVYKNLWMSPNFVIDRMALLAQKYDIRIILSKSQFKHEREAWVAAVFLGLGEVEGSQYWLEVNTENDTPDIYAYYLREVRGSNHRDVLPLEVVDFEEHSQTITSLIEQKLKKSYPSSFALIVYARKAGALIDYDEIFEEVRKLHTPFREIWILAAVDCEDDYHLTMIHPEKLQISFNLKRAYERNKNQKSLGTMVKRGTGTKPQLLGIKKVPFPEI